MKYKSLVSVAIASALSASVYADHGVDAKDLVGKVYGGIHYSIFEADSDRLVVPNVNNSSLDDGDGFGLDLGYRLSEFNEIRFQYTDLDVDADNGAFGSVDGSSVGIDLLHFPTKQSFYVLAGLKEIDLENSELSANVGLGYRHYFNEKFAAYAEGRGHYQFDESHKDFSAGIGLMYFFGVDSHKSKPKPAPAPAVKPETKPKPVLKDTDRDGVYDRYDQCENTPREDKVDARGCTVFTEETETMALLINFDNNKANVKAEYMDEVQRAVNFMKKYPHVNLTIEGHTSSQGAAAYNKKLSQKRANEVVRIMVEQFGIDSDRLTAVGYGEEQLLDSANTAKAHKENRRIQAKVSVTEKVAVKK